MRLWWHTLPKSERHFGQTFTNMTTGTAPESGPVL